MANSKVKSLSDADSRLAELNTKILALETERTDLLAAELANAESRVEEIQAFIGVYKGAPRGASVAAPPRRASKKAAGKRRGPAPKTAAKAKRRGRPPLSTRPTAKKGSRRRNTLERLETIKKMVRAAGNAGISARRISKETGYPYVSVLNLMNSEADFRKVGEKRDRRYFLR